MKLCGRVGDIFERLYPKGGKSLDRETVGRVHKEEIKFCFGHIAIKKFLILETSPMFSWRF